MRSVCSRTFSSYLVVKKQRILSLIVSLIEIFFFPRLQTFKELWTQALIFYLLQFLPQSVFWGNDTLLTSIVFKIAHKGMQRGLLKLWSYNICKLQLIIASYRLCIFLLSFIFKTVCFASPAWDAAFTSQVGDWLYKTVRATVKAHVSFVWGSGEHCVQEPRSGLCSH